jgi:hypothetical protein
LGGVRSIKNRLFVANEDLKSAHNNLNAVNQRLVVDLLSRDNSLNVCRHSLWQSQREEASGMRSSKAANSSGEKQPEKETFSAPEISK